MIKKKDTTPLLEDSEIEDLLKQSLEKEKKKSPKKKTIEKIKPIPMEKPAPKPVKKEIKKQQEKIVAALKTIEVKKELPIITPEISLNLEYEYKKVIRYDLNWYYLKEKFALIKSKIFGKKNNNEIKKDTDEFLELCASIPKLENIIHKNANELSKERLRKTLLIGEKNE
jgi:hypothetical protein